MKRRNREAAVHKADPRNIIRKIFIAVFIFLFIASFFYFKDILRNLEYFRVKDVVVDSEGTGDFSYFNGRNIFDIDVTQEAEYISQGYPGYKRIKVIRVLPNRIYIDFVKRKPIAVLKLYRLFSVDDEQVLFETGNEAAMQELPLVVGLETKIFGPKAGVRYGVKELTSAMQIIRSIQGNRALRDYRIKTIQVHDKNYLTCFISTPPVLFASDQKQPLSGSNILQIRFSQEGLLDKLDLLAGLFSQIQNDLSKISYIDLRFKEPVVKFRDDKK